MAEEELFYFFIIPVFHVLQSVSTRSLYLCFYKGPALLEMEIQWAFCLLGCSGLVAALIKQVEIFPFLCTLPSSGGWLNQIMCSAILNQLGKCRIPVPSSRFRRDARLSTEGFHSRIQPESSLFPGSRGEERWCCARGWGRGRCCFLHLNQTRKRLLAACSSVSNYRALSTH